jgi:hypothetical protein
VVDLAEIQAAYYMVAATGVLVAAIYYLMNIRATQRNSKTALETRQAQLFMEIYKEYFQPHFADAYYIIQGLEMKNAEDYKKLFKDKSKYNAFGTFGVYYEGIGVLVRENLVPIRLVSLMLSGNIIWFWSTYGDAIKDARREFNWPRFFVEIEYLFDRVVEYGTQHPELKVSVPTHN